MDPREQGRPERHCNATVVGTEALRSGRCAARSDDRSQLRQSQEQSGERNLSGAER